MGFWELKNFNDAMLAKQVWRLLKNQDSLFYRFFKSKYFPHGSIFDAKDTKGSFAWKSILKGRELIKGGLMRRIGDGAQVRIFMMLGCLGLNTVKFFPLPLKAMQMPWFIA